MICWKVHFRLVTLFCLNICTLLFFLPFTCASCYLFFPEQLNFVFPQHLHLVFCLPLAFLSPITMCHSFWLLSLQCGAFDQLLLLYLQHMRCSRKFTHLSCSSMPFVAGCNKAKCSKSPVQTGVYTLSFRQHHCMCSPEYVLTANCPYCKVPVQSKYSDMLLVTLFLYSDFLM